MLPSGILREPFVVELERELTKIHYITRHAASRIYCHQFRVVFLERTERICV